METCRLLSGYLDRLAAKYPSTKFVSIVGDKVSYPLRSRLLTLWSSAPPSATSILFYLALTSLLSEFHQCIENYPDRNLPTLLCYRNGELHRQIIGLRPEIGLSGMDTKLEGTSNLFSWHRHFVLLFGVRIAHSLACLWPNSRTFSRYRITPHSCRHA